MYFNKMCNPRFSMLEQTTQKRHKNGKNKLYKISCIELSECPQLKSLGNCNEALKFHQAKNARAMYKTFKNFTSTSL